MFTGQLQPFNNQQEKEGDKAPEAEGKQELPPLPPGPPPPQPAAPGTTTFYPPTSPGELTQYQSIYTE